MLSNSEPIPPHIRTDRSSALVFDIPGYLGFLVATPSAPALWTLPAVGTQVRGSPLCLRNDGTAGITLQSLDSTISGPTMVPAAFVATLIFADHWYCTIASITGGGGPGADARVYTLVTGRVVATDAVTIAGSFPWRQSLMGGFTQGFLVYAHQEVNVPLVVVLRTDLGQLLASQVTFSSGIIEVMLGALPTADCTVNLQVYKLFAGGTAPQLLNATLQLQ